MSRRATMSDGCLPGFLKGLGAMGAAALASPAIAQSATPVPRRIDVHHHVCPTKSFAVKREFILGSSDKPPTIMTEWSPTQAAQR